MQGTHLPMCDAQTRGHAWLGSVRMYTSVCLVILGLLGCRDFGDPVIPNDGAGTPATLTITSPSEPFQIAVGEEFQLVARVLDEQGNPVPGATILWFSSDESLITVSATGMAVAVQVGSAQLWAISGSLDSGMFSVTVVDTVGSPLTITTDPLGTLQKRSGDVLQFQAEVRDDQGTVVTKAPITWTSSDPSVVSIDANGLATMVNPGTSEIRAASTQILSMPVTVEVFPSLSFEVVIQPIFSNSCGFSGCHGGANPKDGLNLEPGSAYDEIVNVRSTNLADWLLVNPGLPDSSLLYLKVSSDSPPTGSRMPLGSVLSTAEIQTIRDWITSGAAR